jgi:methionyl-tRNA formyltransferase
MATAPFRLGLFADGAVGRRIVEHVLAEHPGDLALLVVRSDEIPAWLAGAMRGGADGPTVMPWEELRTPAGARRAAALALDTIVLAWWPFLVAAAERRLARRHFLNLHPSLLPHGRGKDPNFWALAEARPFGVTIHHVDDTIDGGDIAFQEPIATGWSDTGESLYRKAEAEIAALFARSYAAIASGAVPRMPQPPGGSFHRRAELDPASRLDLDGSYRLRDLLNLLRARTFPPHPACRFEDGEDVFEVRVSIDKV